MIFAETNLQKKQPIVSVIINCHNGERYLKEAIDSVYAQSFKEWEIIFFDNASTDNSALIAQSYDDKLVYIRHDSVVPLYAARNLALDHCSGIAISFIDCDDIWMPKKLEYQMKLFEQGAKFVYGGYEIIDSAGVKTGVKQEQYFTGLITRKLIQKNMISIGCVLVDAKLLKEYRFDPLYELLGDFDLWVRLSLENNFWCVPQVLELSRQHEANLSDLKKHQWHIERRIFYRKIFKKNISKFLPQLLYYVLKTEIKGLKSVYK